MAQRTFQEILDDLIKQSEEEKSHYYVNAVLKSCREKITELEGQREVAERQEGLLAEANDTIAEMQGNVYGYEKRIDILEDYIDFLNEANESPITIASIHGWKCPQRDIDKGIEYRKKLNIT